MWQCLNDFLRCVENFFEGYAFLKDFIIAFIGVVFGGVVTVLINRGARRKQALFELQYDILKKQAESAETIEKDVEALEILLSFRKITMADAEEKIASVNSALIKLNENLREKRMFVRKYLKAVSVERSAQIVSDYMKVFYVVGKNGFLDLKLKESLDNDDIESLRQIDRDVKSLWHELIESMETMVAPGLLAKLRRKLRKPAMLVEEAGAIAKVQRENKKRSR